MVPMRRVAALAVLGLSTLVTSGCLPIAATGVAVGALAVTDRRSVGAQTEDTEIEVKASNRLSEVFKNANSVSVTSYNRRVLITGQLPNAAARAEAERAVRRAPGIRDVYNEIEVGNVVSSSTSASDTSITAKVKTAFLEQKALSTTAVKVVTENSVVYLMGLVTQAEGSAYAGVASRVNGVKRVVTLFEYVTQEELAKRTGQK